MTAKIAADVEDIGFLATAAECNGVPREVAYLWMKRAKTNEAGPHLAAYVEFARQVVKARARHVHGQIKALSDPRWRLERLDPEQFAPPKHEVVLTGTLDVSARSDAELEAIIAGKVLP